MSVRIMSQVWELKLPHATKFVLLAMADHADHDGNNVYPSVHTIANKTGYSDRQVQRIITSLEDQGLLIPVQSGACMATVYRIDTANAERVDMRRKAGRPAAATKAISAPKLVTTCHQFQLTEGDIHDTDNGQNVTLKGDILTPSLIPIKEPSIEPSYKPIARNARVCVEKPEIVTSLVFNLGGEDFCLAQPAQTKVISKTLSPYPADMLAFWNSYPTIGRERGSLKDLQMSWVKLSAVEKLDAVSGLHIALQSKQFREYPKAPHRWTQGRCWEVFLGGMTPIPALVPALPHGAQSAMAKDSDEREGRFKLLRERNLAERKLL